MIFQYLLMGGKWALLLLFFSWLSPIAYITGFLFTKTTIAILSRLKVSEKFCRYAALSLATFLSLGAYLLVIYWIF
ncbi:MAG TPA: hypothetical protein VNM22_03005 [Candidatus Limnocylindrales bacterium]|nr:hypothetical protein [Candidatus Limnocylindrales bacterium]